jgi:hypothetical protein
MRILGSLLLVLAVGCRPPGYGKGDDDAPVDAATDADVEPTIDGATPIDALQVTCDAPFRLEGQDTATSVWLTGDFVGWAGQPADGAIVLVLGGDGAWTATHTFDAGTYQYKFIVDGSMWITDPSNPDTIDDTLGGFNSVYTCAAN